MPARFMARCDEDSHMTAEERKLVFKLFILTIVLDGKFARNWGRTRGHEPRGHEPRDLPLPT